MRWSRIGSDPRLRYWNSSWPQTGWHLNQNQNFKGTLAKEIKIWVMHAFFGDGEKKPRWNGRHMRTANKAVALILDIIKSCNKVISDVSRSLKVMSSKYGV